MKYQGLVRASLLVFTSSVSTIMFVGLVLQPSPVQLGLGLAPETLVEAGSTGIAPANSETVPTGQTPAAATTTPVVTLKPGQTATPVSKTTTSTATATPKPAGGTAVPTPKPATPTPTPVPAGPACGSANGTCTAAQVAAHNSRTNCWMIYNGYYYIVTSYVNSHPGGTSVFNSSTCGINATGYLNGSTSTGGKKHNHGGSTYTILNSYKVGPVQG